MVKEGSAALASVFAAFEGQNDAETQLHSAYAHLSPEHQKIAEAFNKALDGVMKRSVITRQKGSKTARDIVDKYLSEHESPQNAEEANQDDPLLGVLVPSFAFAFRTATEMPETSSTVSCNMIAIAEVLMSRAPRRAVTKAGDIFPPILAFASCAMREPARLATATFTRFFPESNPDKRSKLFKKIRSSMFGRIERVSNVVVEARAEDAEEVQNVLAASYDSLRVIIGEIDNEGKEAYLVDLEALATKDRIGPAVFIRPENTGLLRLAALQLLGAYPDALAGLRPPDHPLPAILIKLCSKLPEGETSPVTAARLRLIANCLKFNAAQVVADTKVQANLTKRMCAVTTRFGLARDASIVPAMLNLFYLLPKSETRKALDVSAAIPPGISYENPMSLVFLRSLICSLFRGWDVSKLVFNQMSRFSLPPDTPPPVRDMDSAADLPRVITHINELQKSEAPHYPSEEQCWLARLWLESITGEISPGLVGSFLPIPVKDMWNDLLPALEQYFHDLDSHVAEDVKQLLCADLTTALEKFLLVLPEQVELPNQLTILKALVLLGGLTDTSIELTLTRARKRMDAEDITRDESRVLAYIAWHCGGTVADQRKLIGSIVKSSMPLEVKERKLNLLLSKCADPDLELPDATYRAVMVSLGKLPRPSKESLIPLLHELSDLHGQNRAAVISLCHKLADLPTLTLADAEPLIDYIRGAEGGGDAFFRSIVADLVISGLKVRNMQMPDISDALAEVMAQAKYYGCVNLQVPPKGLEAVVSKLLQSPRALEDKNLGHLLELLPEYWHILGPKLLRQGLNPFPEALHRLLVYLVGSKLIRPFLKNISNSYMTIALTAALGAHEPFGANDLHLPSYTFADVDLTALEELWTKDVWEDSKHVWKACQALLGRDFGFTGVLSERAAQPLILMAEDVDTLAEWEKIWQGLQTRSSKTAWLCVLVAKLREGSDWYSTALLGDSEKARASRLVSELLRLDLGDAEGSAVLTCCLLLIHRDNLWTVTVPNLCALWAERFEDLVAGEGDSEIIANVGTYLNCEIFPWFVQKLEEAEAELEPSTVLISLESTSAMLAPVTQLLLLTQRLKRGLGVADPTEEKVTEAATPDPEYDPASDCELWDEGAANMIEAYGRLIERFGALKEVIQSNADEIDYMRETRRHVMLLTQLLTSLETSHNCPDLHATVYEALRKYPWTSLPLLDFLAKPRKGGGAESPCGVSESEVTTGSQAVHTALLKCLTKDLPLDTSAEDSLAFWLSLVFGRHIARIFVQSISKESSSQILVLGAEQMGINFDVQQVVLAATTVNLLESPGKPVLGENEDLSLTPSLRKVYDFLNRPETALQALLIRPRTRVPSRLEAYGTVAALNSGLQPSSLDGYYPAWIPPNTQRCPVAILLAAATQQLVPNSVNLSRAVELVTTCCLNYPDAFREVYDEDLTKDGRHLLARIQDNDHVSNGWRQHFAAQADALGTLFRDEIAVNFDGAQWICTVWDESREVKLKARLGVQPKRYPLRLPEFSLGEGTAPTGVSALTLRSWTVCVMRILRGSQCKAISDPAELPWLAGGAFNFMYAIAQIADKFAHVFAETQECLICYSVLHRTTKQLPKRQCSSCGNYFHAHCLQQWYETSHNTKCPLCRCVL